MSDWISVKDRLPEKDGEKQQDDEMRYIEKLDKIMDYAEEHFGKKYMIKFDSEDEDVFENVLEAFVYAEMGQLANSSELKDIICKIADNGLKELGW